MHNIFIGFSCLMLSAKMKWGQRLVSRVEGWAHSELTLRLFCINDIIGFLLRFEVID